MESSTYMPIKRWMDNENVLLYSIYLTVNKIGIVKVSENKQKELEIIMSKKPILWETNAACPPLSEVLLLNLYISIYMQMGMGI